MKIEASNKKDHFILTGMRNRFHIHTAKVINRLKIPARESDKTVAIIIVIATILPKYRFHPFCVVSRRQKGKPAQRQAANPAVLSSVPVILVNP